MPGARGRGRRPNPSRIGTFRKSGSGYRSAVGQKGYRTPGEAALSSYSPAAGAFVVRVITDGNMAKVEIDTDPSHPYFITCERKGRLWYERFGHN